MSEATTNEELPIPKGAWIAIGAGAGMMLGAAEGGIGTGVGLVLGAGAGAAYEAFKFRIN